MQGQTAAIAHNLLTVYFIQGLTLLALLYLIFSGQIKKIISKIMSIRRVKVGNIEIETDCTGSEPERRKMYRRSTDGMFCAHHGDIVKSIAGIEAKIAKLEEHTEEIWVEQLKHTFYSENPKLPLADKMYAGLRYVWWGRNGEMKSDVLAMCMKQPDVYKAIIRLRPELKLEEFEKNYK